MHPILFQSGSFVLMAYPFFLLLGGLVVVFGSLYFAKKRGMPKSASFLSLAGMFVSAFLGARILHILLNREFYRNNPERYLSLDSSGFSLFGGVVAAIVTGYIIARWKKLNVWKLGDTVVPCLGIGIAIMRVGCFLNGCCFGKETDLFLGVTFPFFSQAHKYQIAHNQANLFTVNPVHPTELYELVAALFGSLLAVYILRKKYPDGVAFLIFVIWFSAFRWINYYLRIMPVTFDASANFYPLFYFGLIVLSVTFLSLRLKNRQLE